MARTTSAFTTRMTTPVNMMASEIFAGGSPKRWTTDIHKVHKKFV